MKKLIITASFTALVWTFFSCSGDSEEALFNAPDCTVPISLNTDVMPLLQSNCAIDGCHTAGSGLPNFMEKEKVLEYADAIKRRTRDGSMPPPYSGIVLTEQEINMITCWVDQGKKNN